jgi:hypothetical protein
MFNVARKGLIVLKGGVPSENPVAAVSLDRESNIRDRVLSREEFDRLIGVAPLHLKPMLLTAYHTGMRKGGNPQLSVGSCRLQGGYDSPAPRIPRRKRDDSYP